MPLPVKAQLATSACEKPDSSAPPAMPVTFASEQLDAWAVTPVADVEELLGLGQRCRQRQGAGSSRAGDEAFEHAENC